MFKKVNLGIKGSRMKRLHNNRGAELVISLFILTIILGLSVSMAVSSVHELKTSQRYEDSMRAFWLAEAGINRFIQDTTMLDGGDQTIYFGSNYVNLQKDDTDPQERVVTAIGNIGGVNRSLEVKFPSNPPDLFDNTMSSGGGIILDGAIAGVDVDGKTRITGVYDDQGFFTTANFEDKVEGVSSSLTTIEYPDANGNSIADEFEDFVALNRTYVDPDDPNYTGEYSQSEVLHIQTNDPVDIWPTSDLTGKKVIFVEGATAGSGDVNIWFDSTWASDQNVTVVSTGSVNYIQPLQNPASNSQLNTISWEDYNEASIFLSTHSGVTYTHAQANYGSIISLSETTGNLVANSGVHLDLILVWKEFDYESPIDENGLVPPAFQGIIAGGSGGYASVPSSWSEI